VCQRFTQGTVRQQPWHFVAQVARRLPSLGHHVVLVTDGGGTSPVEEEVAGIEVRRVPSVRRPTFLGNKTLDRVLASERPDVTIWNLGTTSLMHVGLRGAPGQQIGLFTSPLYRASAVLDPKLHHLRLEPEAMAMHGIPAVIPRRLLRWRLRSPAIRGYLVQSDQLRNEMVRTGVPADRVRAVGTGVEDVWRTSVPDGAAVSRRRQLGITDTEQVVSYLGSPALIRGPDTLIEAVAECRARLANLRLLLLLRCHDGGFVGQQRLLDDLITRRGLRDAVHTVSGLLPPSEVREWVAASDVVALPFKIVPSDAPVAPLEVIAAGCPLVTTPIGGLANLARFGPVYMSTPGDKSTLATAILQALAEDASSQSTRRDPIPTWEDVTAHVIDAVTTFTAGAAA